MEKITTYIEEWLGLFRKWNNKLKLVFFWVHKTGPLLNEYDRIMALSSILLTSHTVPKREITIFSSVGSSTTDIEHSL